MTICKCYKFSQSLGSNAIRYADVGIKTAKIIAEKIRKSCENQKLIHKKQEISFTVSFGIAEYKNGESADQIIEHADAKLYEAKKSGEKCVVDFLNVHNVSITNVLYVGKRPSAKSISSLMKPKILEYE